MSVLDYSAKQQPKSFRTSVFCAAFTASAVALAYAVLGRYWTNPYLPPPDWVRNIFRWYQMAMLISLGLVTLPASVVSLCMIFSRRSSKWQLNVVIGGCIFALAAPFVLSSFIPGQELDLPYQRIMYISRALGQCTDIFAVDHGGLFPPH